MLFRLLLLGILTASSAAANTVFCGTPPPTQKQMKMAQALQLHEAGTRLERSAAHNSSINIDIYYHDIADGEDEIDGYVSAAALARQTEALNDAYRPHNITFNQVSADWLVSPVFSGNQEERAMKKALRQGTYADLNVYLFSRIEYIDDKWQGPFGEVLGHCADFPMNVTKGSDEWYNDGILIRADTLPGSDSGFNLGKTLIHESGHWLGLYYTFQESCDGDRDRIDDTPAEDWMPSMTGDWACNLTRNSCPDKPGFDPVTNHMDYTEETCRVEFSHGQEIRMYSQWKEFRAPHQKA